VQIKRFECDVKKRLSGIQVFMMPAEAEVMGALSRPLARLCQLGNAINFSLSLNTYRA
jgi:hypothetical protein